MKLYPFYAVYVNGKYKIYSEWTFFNRKKRDYCNTIQLESKTRYLAKKELFAKFEGVLCHYI